MSKRVGCILVVLGTGVLWLCFHTEFQLMYFPVMVSQ